MSSQRDSPHSSSKVTTAVEFLTDVSPKGYSEVVLKKYLIKRGLTEQEVDVAFLINKNRLEAKEEGKEAVKDRPEKHSFADRKQVHDVGFLEAAKRPNGEKLINDFLDTESVYCSILECLKKDYYDVLARFANRGRIDMSRKEVDEIFFRIPDLLKFHKNFFLDIKRGSHISRMFVRLFKFFEGYAEYMKDCQKTVTKMRKYVRDPRLNACLVQISDSSIKPNNDMIDLLLTPLERILDYRDFLSKLYSWGDRTQTADYELLGKAARRIGRVASYIEKYRYGICNQNEMNKVQKFLSDQCDILSPDRSIVRRGMMVKRSSGWTARKKRYIFFLFNDMLLWTNKNGKLQNAMQLRSCEVMPSSAKNNALRKFEIVYRGERHKSLKLECEQVKERNEWYQSVKKTIAGAKDTCNLAWSRSQSNAFAKYKEYSHEQSDEESKDEDSRTIKDENEESKLEQSEQIDDPYNNRYAVTSSFKIQEFKEIDPMDDNVSEISEQDVAFHKKHSDYAMLSVSSKLSPFGDDKNNKRDANMFRVRGPSKKGDTTAKVQNNTSKAQHQENKENSFEFFDRQRKKSNIIRRSSSNNDAREETSPRYTIRLNSF